MMRKFVYVIALLALLFPLAGGGQMPGRVMVNTAEAQEKVTIRWATIAGFYTDWIEEVVKEFEEKTGIEVEIVDIDFPLLYEKQVVEMVGKTGAYDIFTLDVAWAAEWPHAGYILPLDDYIAASDPEEIAFEDLAPSLVVASCMWQGEVIALPFYTFSMGYFYRKDLWENPGEQEAFFNKYGYKLMVPATWEQVADYAEFFHRKPGETLKGEPLEEEFYGIGLMAGRFPHIQDEYDSILWSWGGDVVNLDGSPGVDDEVGIKAMKFYVEELLPHAPPGALTSAYDEVVGQMRQGMIAQTAAFYLDQWPNMVKTEVEVPGAQIGCSIAPGNHPWRGALSMGISVDSKHPDEAWELLKFVNSPEAQRKFALGGGSTARLSILRDPEISSHHECCGHFKELANVLTVYEDQVPNYYFVPQAGKIYDEMTVWCSSAASGEFTVEEAMGKLAEAIERHCGGPCEVLR